MCNSHSMRKTSSRTSRNENNNKQNDDSIKQGRRKSNKSPTSVTAAFDNKSNNSNSSINQLASSMATIDLDESQTSQQPQRTKPTRRRSSLKTTSKYSSDENYNLDSSIITKSPPQRRVSFARKAKVKPTISIKDMTDSERHQSWLQDHEQASIRKHCQKLIAKVERFGSKLGNGRRLCIRGLESQMGDGLRKKQRNRFLSTDEVLYEQERQHMEGYYDDEAIANIYKEISGECQIEAELSAALDRKEIEHYISSSFK